MMDMEYDNSNVVAPVSGDVACPDATTWEIVKDLPLSALTIERLLAGPEEGKTHLWLAQIAGGVRNVLNRKGCFKFLRRCTDEFVTHRDVEEHEIEDAVDLAYGPPRGSYRGCQTLSWPDADPAAIAKVIAAVEPLFDGVTDTKLEAKDVLPLLFKPGELVCSGKDSRSATIRPVEVVMQDANRLQFIVLNPMKGGSALNRRGLSSVRCQANVRERRYIVAEFDDTSLTKRHQAQLATALGRIARLVLAVHSGGKSVHAWFEVGHMSLKEQARFFYVACLLGADATRWDICGWLRMPGGLRDVDGTAGVRQKILFFKAAEGGSK